MTAAWLRSLARRTDLIFARHDGEVSAHADWLCVRTRSNPDYHWGNLLIFAAPPTVADVRVWPARFADCFGDDARVRHRLFSWEGRASAEALAAFAAAGYRLEHGEVLCATRLLPPRWPRPDLEIRPLAGEAEWEAAIQLQLRCRHPMFTLAQTEPFKRRQFETYRALAAAGRGAWFGAFAGGRLVGDLGLFCETGLGRYQNVGTDPDFRRQGVCAQLVSTAGRLALAQWGVEQLVIEAEADSAAGRIYRALGFGLVETNQSLSWWEGMP